MLSFRHHSGQVLRSRVVGLVFITAHLQLLEEMPGVSKLACVIQAIATPFLKKLLEEINVKYTRV